MQNLLYDLRFALRQLRNSLGIAVLAILTLALGVGANTAIFTVIDSVLLRPLPYAHSDRLVFIGPKRDKPGFGATSWLNYRDIRAQSKLLEDAAGYSEDGTRAGEPGHLPERGRSARDAQSLFHAGQAAPCSDAPLLRQKGVAGGPSVVLLSEGLWRQSFHADPRHRGPGGEAQRQAVHGRRRHARELHLSRGDGSRHADGASGCRCSPPPRC